jgi:hypothetical protein
VVYGGFKKEEGGWYGRFKCIIVDLSCATAKRNLHVLSSLISGQKTQP